MLPARPIDGRGRTALGSGKWAARQERQSSPGSHLVEDVMYKPWILSLALAVILAGCGQAPPPDSGPVAEQKPKPAPPSPSAKKDKTDPKPPPPPQEEPVEPWIEALKGANEERRLEAAQKLARMGPRAAPAVPALTEALNDKFTRIRLQAAEALASVGPEAKSAVPALIERTGDKEKDAKVRDQAVVALARIDPQSPEVLAALGKAFRDRDAVVRQHAEEGLLAARKAAVKILMEAMKDPDTKVRERAVAALGKLEGEAREAVPELSRSLKHQDERVRRQALFALAKIGPRQETVMPGLLEALTEREADVRHFAVVSLTSMGKDARPAVPQLIDLLKKDGDANVREAAAFALGKIDPQADGVLAVLSRAWRDEERGVREEALRALAKCGKPAVPTLIEALRKNFSNDVQIEATKALGQIGPDAKEAVPVLLPLLKDNEEEIRRVAEEALKAIDPSAIKQ